MKVLLYILLAILVIVVLVILAFVAQFVIVCFAMWRPHGKDKVNIMKGFLGYDWGKSATIINEYYHVDGYSEVLIRIDDEEEWKKLQEYCQSQKEEKIETTEDGHECVITTSHHRGTYDAIFKFDKEKLLPPERTEVNVDFYFERHYPHQDPYGYILRVDYSRRMLVFTTLSV